MKSTTRIPFHPKHFWPVEKHKIGLILGIVCFVFCLAAPVNANPPQAQKGVLDLQGWDFPRNGAIELAGEWTFFWHELLTPQMFTKGVMDLQPGFIQATRPWKGQRINGLELPALGFGTYRLIILKDNTPSRLSFDLPLITAAYTLWINGEKVSNCGRVGHDRISENPVLRHNLVHIETTAKRLDLILQVSNFNLHRGGPRTAILLGPADYMATRQQRMIALDLFLIGCITMMGAYHLGLFFVRRTETSALYFGVFCALMALYAFFAGYSHFYSMVFPELSGRMSMRIVPLTFYLMVPVFFCFTRSLFPEVFPPKAFVLFNAAALVFILALVFAPTHIAYGSVDLFRIFILPALLLILMVGIRATRRHQTGAELFVLGIGVFGVSVVNDVLYNLYIIQTTDVVHIGLLLFIFFQAMMLYVRFAGAFTLAESLEQKYRTIFERAVEGLFQVSPQGRFISANPAMARMLGFKSAADLLALGEDGALRFFQDSELYKKFGDMLEQGNAIYKLETQGLRNNGEAFWGLLTVQPVYTHNGEISFFEGSLEDLTTRKEKEQADKALEIAQQHANRLRELDQLKSGFLSSVSHELRTPLTSILGFAKLIKKDFLALKKNMPPTADAKTERKVNRVQSNLDVISREGERLTRLINDVLDLAKIESGRIEWRESIFPVRAAIEQAVQSASGQFTDKPEVDLKVELQADLPCLKADQDRIVQVLVNLLNNAAKFTPSGLVRVSAAATPEGQVKIDVSDTGAGIPEHDIDKVFDQFHQVAHGDTIQKKAAGTGLGLAICKQIIEHYGGKIWVESQVGQGSTFSILIPAVQKDRDLCADPQPCENGK